MGVVAEVTGSGAWVEACVGITFAFVFTLAWVLGGREGVWEGGEGPLSLGGGGILVLSGDSCRPVDSTGSDRWDLSPTICVARVVLTSAMAAAL